MDGNICICQTRETNKRPQCRYWMTLCIPISGISPWDPYGTPWWENATRKCLYYIHELEIGPSIYFTHTLRQYRICLILANDTFLCFRNIANGDELRLFASPSTNNGHRFGIVLTLIEHLLKMKTLEALAFSKKMGIFKVNIDSLIERMSSKISRHSIKPYDSYELPLLTRSFVDNVNWLLSSN